jgi:hypothetical protein
VVWRIVMVIRVVRVVALLLRSAYSTTAGPQPMGVINEVKRLDAWIRRLSPPPCRVTEVVVIGNNARVGVRGRRPWAAEGGYRHGLVEREIGMARHYLVQIVAGRQDRR